MGSIKTRREIVVEKYLKEQVEKIGGKCLKMLPTYDAGVPDRLVLYKGQTVFVETKRQGLSPSKLQAIFMSELNANGFETRVIDEKHQVDELIRDLKSRNSELPTDGPEARNMYLVSAELEHPKECNPSSFIDVSFRRVGPVEFTAEYRIKNTQTARAWLARCRNRYLTLTEINHFYEHFKPE
jgi:hypothetical protein